MQQERAVVKSSDLCGLTEQRAMGKHASHCLCYANSVDINLPSSFYPTNPLLQWGPQGLEFPQEISCENEDGPLSDAWAPERFTSQEGITSRQLTTKATCGYGLIFVSFFLRIHKF